MLYCLLVNKMRRSCMKENQELTQLEKQAIALQRAEELKSYIEPYLQARQSIPDGFSQWDEIQKRQEAIKKYFHVTDHEWQNWHWQLTERITQSDVLQELLSISEQEAAIINKVGANYRWASSPYYLSLIDPDNPNCPVKRLC